MKTERREGDIISSVDLLVPKSIPMRVQVHWDVVFNVLENQFLKYCVGFVFLTLQFRLHVVVSDLCPCIVVLIWCPVVCCKIEAEHQEYQELLMHTNCYLGLHTHSIDLEMKDQCWYHRFHLAGLLVRLMMTCLSEDVLHSPNPGDLPPITQQLFKQRKKQKHQLISECAKNLSKSHPFLPDSEQSDLMLSGRNASELASRTLLLGFLETFGVKFILDIVFCLWNCWFLDRGALARLVLNTLAHGLEHEAACCFF